MLAEQGEEACSLLSGCRALLRSVTKVSQHSPLPPLSSLSSLLSLLSPLHFIKIKVEERRSLPLWKIFIHIFDLTFHFEGFYN